MLHFIQDVFIPLKEFYKFNGFIGTYDVRHITNMKYHSINKIPSQSYACPATLVRLLFS